MKGLKRIALFITLFTLSSPIFAATTFIVKQIQFQGLQQVSQQTAMNYMPIRVGQALTPERSSAVISAMYKTQFFENVELFRENGTLIVKVLEHPTITDVKFVGNKTLTTSKLEPVLAKVDLVPGALFQPSNLNQLVQGMKSEYNQLGYYEVTVTPIVKQLPRNRVSITVKITEGRLAKINSIVFVGNQAFSGRELRAQMKMKKTWIFSWYEKDNRYSEFGLGQDMESLQNFYFDHGYLEFHFVDHSTSTTPNGLQLNFTVFEGPVYTISGYKVVGQWSDDPHIQKIVSTINTGHPFSRTTLMNIDKAVSHYFADEGYAFAKVNVNPTINKADHSVFLTFSIDRGRRVYVTQLNFIGNDHTLDYVLRNQMVQMEDAMYSQRKIDESKQMLQLLPYLKDIQVNTEPDPMNPNGVILDYHVKEFGAGRASVNGGYSDVEGIIYGANVVEPNFLGTGHYASIGFTRGQYSSNYAISYTNPFVTVDHVSRTINLFFNQTKPSRQFNLEPYTVDDFGTSLIYGIPMTLHDAMNIGLGYDYISISNVNRVTPLSAACLNSFQNPNCTLPPVASPGVLQFLNRNGNQFNELTMILGWSHVTLDRAIFPTSGNSQQVNATMGVPVAKSFMGFYKLTYSGKWYFNLTHGFVFETHTDLGYGGGFGSGINSGLPFYNNFYAGGIDTVPGFAPNSLGPLNPNNQFNCVAQTGGAGCARTGGNLELLGGLNFIFPTPLGERFRTALFITAGNIFDTYGAFYTAQQLALNSALRQMSYESVELSNIRVTTGILFNWYSPMGPIELALGFPLHRKKNIDDTQIFGFTFGANI